MRAVWITPCKVLDKNVLYRFEKSITASEASEIELNVSADTRYKLYFNGEYICEGPCQSDHWFWRYETVKIPKELIRDGQNSITVDVLYIAEPTYFTQARLDRASVIVFGKKTDKGKTEEIATDGSWSCKILHGYVFRDVSSIYPRVMQNVPPMAAYTLEKEEEVGAKPYKQCRLDKGSFTPYGLSDDYPLVPRSIKLLKPEAPKPFTELRRTETSCELDAGIYTTAFPVFAFKGERGGKIRFVYAESYTDENGSKLGIRRDVMGAKFDGPYDEIELTGEIQTYEAYFYKAFRYVRAEYPSGTEFVTEKQVYKPYFYECEGEGRINASSLINKVWDVSVNTLKCCTHETFVDCPFYEQCQYDMDTAIEMMVMMRLTNDYSMPRKAVYDLARSQRPDGMLCAHYPTSWVQIIPNFSLFWILMLRDYVTYSGDVDAAKELLPTVDKILNRFDSLLNENGIVGSTPYWNYTDWVPGWERGIPPGGDKLPTAVSSMMYAYALGVASTLADDVGRGGLSSEYLTRKSEMIRAVNECFYDTEKDFFVDTYGEKTYSEHTAVWAVLSDCVSGAKASELLTRSFESDVSRASFSFGYYTFRALEKTGLYKKYSQRLFGGWYKMLDMGCTTWCENPNNPRSECHAWSSAPVFEYSSMLLGVKPSANGFKKAVVEPDLTYTEPISGVVPTPFGSIAVSFKVTDGKADISVTVPKGIEADLKAYGETVPLKEGENVYSLAADR